MRKVAVPAAATHAHMTRLSTNTTKAPHHATGETNGTHDAACATSHQPTQTVTRREYYREGVLNDINKLAIRASESKHTQHGNRQKWQWINSPGTKSIWIIEHLMCHYDTKEQHETKYGQ
jgi:hypothetical protein